MAQPRSSLLATPIAQLSRSTRPPTGNKFIHNLPSSTCVAFSSRRPLWGTTATTGTHASVPVSRSVRKLSQVSEGPIRRQPIWADKPPNQNPNEASRLSHRPVQLALPSEYDEEPIKQNFLPIVIGGRKLPFDCVFLRDSCTCPRCVDPHSKQKLFRTADIPENIRTYMVEWKGPTVNIIWRDDIPGYDRDHVTTIPLRFFHDNSSLARRNQARYNNLDLKYWNRKDIEGGGRIFTKINYEDYMTDDSVLRQALHRLHAFGIIFLKQVPHWETAIENIGGRIGPLRDSFYGKTWDVKSVPNATNVAYTHQDLGLHMDLLYMKEPPSLQILHCLQASNLGGASYFVDSFYAASGLRRQDPIAFQSLVQFPVTYHYHNAGEHYHQRRPTVVLEASADQDVSRDPQAHIAHVNWSPPFQGPFEADIGMHDRGHALRRYLRAAKKFASLIDDPNNQFEYLMQPGDCVIFNNRRVLHARRAFDGNEGVRWLKGAYLDSDPFMSRLRVLNEKFNVREEDIGETVVGRPFQNESKLPLFEQIPGLTTTGTV